jgi:hypothetical protein
MDEEKDRPLDRDVVDTRDESVERERRDEERAAEDQAARMRNARQEQLASLFEKDATEKFRSRWLAIQSKFVDDPSDSVKQADQLVSDVIQDMTKNFANRRGTLEKQWKGGETASTEDLRIALQQYRSFFERLLTLQS